MRGLALALLLVLGCGTAAPSKDGAAAAGGSQAGGAGGGGGKVGAGGEMDAGGVGGRMDASGVDAALATSGPCAGICANPFSAAEEYDGQGIGMGNNPLGCCYAITIATQPYTATFWCATPDVRINGTPVTCPGGTSIPDNYFPVPPESDGDYCVSFGPGAGPDGFVEIR